MQASTSTRAADTTMTPPLAYLLSAAFLPSSISTGKERDPESGDDYFEARYYNSAAGRFLSPDWSAKEEPVPYAKMDDPQTLNLYDYVGNDPMTRIDSDGHKIDFQALANKAWDEIHQITTPPPLPPPPPAPAAAGVTGEAKRAVLQSLANYLPNDGKETVAQIAGRVNSETGGMKDSKAENKPLEKAREEIAHVRMNGEAAFGSRVDSLAGMAPASYSGPDYAACYFATANAAYDNAVGIDPTGGATQMNMRKSMGDTNDFQGKPLQTQSGPYISPSPYKVINTYGP